ncbi:MAG: 16S rRNA (uracil(1498)-N(3))-methyltransferase [Chitinophagaceae bacterium]|nr:16S rRNA (uracil(1498)-N(3))-methyltransferase [Chitinophagaceae bacterium]MCW5906046.1 16S rRNA (uracil(1498)-N(3))-methyltransferase [Chitinophagaceae bacterium]
MQFPFFYEASLINTDTLFTLSTETFKHAIQVLRLKENDIIQLTNGKGLLCTAILKNVDKKQAIAQINEVQYIEPPLIKTCIAISLLKNTSRLEWFLEKATELGISAIMPIICHRTEKQHFRFDRMNTILISAMLQSQQVWLPTLHEPLIFNNIFQHTDYSLKLIAHCSYTEKKSLSSFAIQENSILLIGPEGDFSDEEIALAKKNNYISVSLGNTRLRTETAGVAGAVLLTINK